MSGRQFVFSLLFKGDAASAKAAAAETKQAVEAVAAESQAAASVADKDTAAQKRNAEARREVAAAAKEQAEAEKRAKETARGGIGGAGSPTPAPAPAPVPNNVPPADLEAMKRQYVPLYAAQKAYEAELDGIAKAERAGALTASEVASAQTRARAVYERTTESLRRVDAALGGATGQMKLQGHEARILAMQFNDTFQSLALGMSPLQVLLQQGPQVVDVLGGWGRTMQFLRQSLTGMRLLMGGTAAAVVAGALAWDQYLASTKAVEVAAAGRGASLGVTAGQLNRTAGLGADQANLSVSDSRALLAQLVSSGQIGPQNLEGILGISSDFAVTMGVQADAVGGKLVEMFAKPGKAAEELRSTYGMLTAETVEQIQQLEAQNRKYDAQAVLLAALEGKLVDAERAQSALGRGWGAIKRGFSDTLDAGGGAVDNLYETGNLGQLVAPNPMGMAKATFDLFGAKQDAALVASVQDGIAQAMAPAYEARQKGVLALELADKAAANASVLKTQALRNELAAMQAGLVAGDLSAEQRERLTSAIEGQSNALDALENRHQRALGMAQLDLRIATERNPMRRAELLSQQAMNRAYAEGADTAGMLKAATEARVAAVNEIIAGTANQAAAMMEEASARERLNALVAQGAVSSADASNWLERELALRPLLAAAARAEGEDKKRLEEEIRNLISGYDALAAARRQELVDADGKAANGRIAQLRLEASLIGQSAAARTRALAVAEAERRMRDIGITDLNDPRLADARKKALEEADAQIERDRRQRQLDLSNQLTADAYGASARLARNPIDRAEIEAQAAYAAAIAQTGDADEAAARAAQVRSRALAELRGQMADMAVEQEEQLERLRLEASLLGLSDQARARAMASYEADVQMRAMGVDLASAEAQARRDQAVLIADQRREVEKLADAWSKVRSSAEAAVDGPIDALLKGDFDGALTSLSEEIAGLFSELAIKNPLKNALFGSDYATMQDLGGLQGIWARLTGREAGNPVVSTMGQSVSSMAVTAASVMISGPGASAIMSGAAAGGMSNGMAANSPKMGGAAATGLPGSADVQAQIWSFFANKGLKPHQIAGIMGNVAGESGFNPMAVGDGGDAVGLFQWNDRRHKLFDFIGGKENLGNVQGQLEFAWHELMTSERPAFDRLMKSSNASEATDAFMRGFERPAEWAMADSWATRMNGAEAALAKFGNTTTSATANLGTLGTGFDAFGNALAQGLNGMASGGGQGGLMGFLSALAGGIAGGLGIPGFAAGGDHAGGWRIVGERGPELEFTGASRIVNAEQTKALLTRPAPVIAVQRPANTPAAPVIQLHPVLVNNTSRQVDMEVEETTDARGQRQQRFVISDAVGEGLATPGGRAGRSMRDIYGVNRPVRRRS